MNNDQKLSSSATSATGAPGETRAVPWVLGGLVAVIAALGGGLMWRAERATNHVALADAPRPVTAVRAQAAEYRPHRTYVGTFQPWVEAQIGPQLVSAYVDTVLVRPGAHVRRGEVLATLDCRNASASSQAVAMQARALDARQQAVAHEAARTQGMLGGGFVSANEAERIAAQSTAETAELAATQARLMSTHLQVDDCVLRAPFDGEVARRFMDPGAFARPGAAVVSLVDRRTVRLSGNAPEGDFDAIAPGTAVQVHCDATHKDFAAVVTRRAPSADAGTRTVLFEIDLADPQRAIPVGTTGEIGIAVGAPQKAVRIPLAAAAMRNGTATLFTVQANKARQQTLAMLGEDAQWIYLDPALGEGAQVVLEGRALLSDGDAVQATEEVQP